MIKAVMYCDACGVEMFSTGFGGCPDTGYNLLKKKEDLKGTCLGPDLCENCTEDDLEGKD